MAGRYQKKRKNSFFPKLLLFLLITAMVVCAIRFGPELLRGSQETYPSSLPSGDKPETTGSTPTVTASPQAESSAETDPPTEESTEPEETAWSLVLVNTDNPLPESWDIELTELRYGEQVDSRMYPYLQDMFDACRADGLLPMVNSSFRSHADQQRIMNNYIADYLAQGYSEADAKTEAEKWVAIPGTSEHQLGLAVDIDSDDLSQCSNEAVWSWMAEHCAEYGFILRYPEGKEDITGIAHEPWHFRYVGKEAAAEIMASGLTLEEYLENKLG